MTYPVLHGRQSAWTRNGSLEKLSVVIIPFYHNSHSGGKKGVNATLHFYHAMFHISSKMWHLCHCYLCRDGCVECSTGKNEVWHFLSDYCGKKRVNNTLFPVRHLHCDSCLCTLSASNIIPFNVNFACDIQPSLHLLNFLKKSFLKFLFMLFFRLLTYRISSIGGRESFPPLEILNDYNL